MRKLALLSMLLLAPLAIAASVAFSAEPRRLSGVSGTVYAVDNACPHRGGPLGEGELQGRVLTCPWHGWRWDVTTGASANTPGLRVGCVPVTPAGTDLLVTLP